MKTPTEKAKELVEKFKPFVTNGVGGKKSSIYETENAKQCALIAVDEIINSEPTDPSPMDDNIIDSGEQARQYWQQVRTEIEKL